MIKYGLRSKRFRLVSEQRKTERDFRFWPREKWNESTRTIFCPVFDCVPRFLHLNRTETLATQAT